MNQLVRLNPINYIKPKRSTSFINWICQFRRGEMSFQIELTIGVTRWLKTKWVSKTDKSLDCNSSVQRQYILSVKKACNYWQIWSECPFKPGDRKESPFLQVARGATYLNYNIHIWASRELQFQKIESLWNKTMHLKHNFCLFY